MKASLLYLSLLAVKGAHDLKSMCSHPKTEGMNGKGPVGVLVSRTPAISAKSNLLGMYRGRLTFGCENIRGVEGEKVLYLPHYSLSHPALFIELLE